MKELLIKVNENIAELNEEINEVEFDFYERTKPYRDQKYGKSEFQEKYGPKLYYFNLNVFQGKSHLMIPSTVDDYGVRPQLGIDYNSHGIQVLKNNLPIDQIDSPGKYKIKCKVQNNGDLSVPVANVEFFMAPKFKSNDLEIHISNIKATPIRAKIARMNYKVTVDGEIKKGTLHLLQYVNILGDSEVMHTRVTKLTVKNNGQIAAANFAEEGDIVVLEFEVSPAQSNGLKNAYQIIGDHPVVDPGTKDFRLKVEDVFSISGRGTVVTGKVEQGKAKVGDTFSLLRGGTKLTDLTATGFEGFRQTINEVSTGMDVGILFRGTTKDMFKKGDVLLKLSEATNKGIPLPKPDTLSDFEYLGKVAVDVPALGSSFAELEVDIDKIGAKGKIFACRAFSLLPIDMPENFDSLDSKYNRHVGLLEL